MDNVSQVVAAIIAKSEGVRSDGQELSVVLYKPNSRNRLTLETFAMPLPDLVRAVSRALAAADDG